MINIVFGVILFLNVLEYFIIFDVILSFLVLAGVRWRPKFLRDIVDPLYDSVRRVLPVFIGPFDLTPIILILLFRFAIGLLVVLFPEVRVFF